MAARQLGTFTDESGLATVVTFMSEAGSEQDLFNDFAAEVPDDFVVIGGGVEGARLPLGALLTASYPNTELSAWLGSAKAHQESSPFKIKVWATGLKIKGMSKDDLRNCIHVTSTTSSIGLTPEATATTPQGNILVSGGFHVNYFGGGGNLATASFPENAFAWKAKSKAHFVVNDAEITSHGISIKENLPIGKRVEVFIKSVGSASAVHPSASADLPPGYAMTGGGGEIHWQQPGCLLWRLYPLIETTNQEFTASGKAHFGVTTATVTAYAMGIKLV